MGGFVVWNEIVGLFEDEEDGGEEDDEAGCDGELDEVAGRW